MRLGHLLALVILGISSPASLPASDVSQTRAVSVGGETFDVRIDASRRFAVVTPANPHAIITMRLATRAARAATGCAASVSGLAAMLAGGKETEPIDYRKLPEGRGVPVRLRC